MYLGSPELTRVRVGYAKVSWLTNTRIFMILLFGKLYYMYITSEKTIMEAAYHSILYFISLFRRICKIIKQIMLSLS